MENQGDIVFVIQITVMLPIDHIILGLIRMVLQKCDHSSVQGFFAPRDSLSLVMHKMN